MRLITLFHMILFLTKLLDRIHELHKWKRKVSYINLDQYDEIKGWSTCDSSEDEILY